MRAFFFDCGTRDATASAGLLALRVCTGLMMFIGHGFPKLMGFPEVVKHFPVPGFFPFSIVPANLAAEVSLIACLTGELVAAGFLVVGLATRSAAFLMGFTMVVAAFHFHGNDPWFLGPGVESAKEPALLYVIPCIALILAGGGAYSLDAALHRGQRRRRW